MCGIAGYLGKKQIDAAKIPSTLKLMGNRGPDHSDSVIKNENNLCMALLHSRLSIIDLDPRSNQPFSVGPLTVVFNGEIYNYVELRERLEKQGIQFKTSSDTEVLVQSWLAKGPDCVKDFEGMWSFAIYDARTRELFLSRDRFAEKPLYYLQTADGIYFGSEVKFIQSLSGAALSPNEQHLLRYLVNGYRASYKTADTFFEGVREVPYASTLQVNSRIESKMARYWQPEFQRQEMSLEQAIEGFRHHLMESVKIRLRSDVPLAFCLSGGVDSSSIASIAAKVFKYDVATFSIIDSDERYNELDNIQATIDDLGCKHTLIEIKPESDDFFVRLEKLVAYHDAPLYTITYFVHSLLIEAIARQGYKVSISGHGADEMATGYYDHFILHLYEMRNRPDYREYLEDWTQHVLPFVRNPFLRTPDLYFNNPSFRDHIYLNNDIFAGFLKRDFQEGFAEESFTAGLLRNRMLNELFHEAVPVALHDDDLNSMFYSVENRAPYLDSRLFKFAYSIPEEYLIRDGYGKYVLRESMKGILNDQVRLDRCKKGFNASIHSLIDLEQKKVREFILDDSRIYDFFEKSKIEELLSMNPMPNSYSKFFFSFLNAKIFLSRCFSSQPGPAAAGR